MLNANYKKRSNLNYKSIIVQKMKEI